MPGVYAVHRQTKAVSPELKRFVVTEDASGSGALTISPAIIATGVYKNVSALPADNAILTFDGSANTSYRRSLLFQKGFAAFGTADLVKPPNENASSKNFQGLSMRCIVDSYDPRTDILITRLDILYGYTMLRPQLASSIWHT